MNLRQKLSLATICFALPSLVAAQAAPAAEPAAAPAPAPVVAPAEPPPAPPAPAPAPTAAPAADKVSITPYGTISLAYYQSNGRFGTKDIPLQVTSEDGKSNVISVRQTRIGWNLGYKDDNWTRADLGGKLEFDFNAGSVPAVFTTNACTPPTCTTTGAATSSAYNNALVRLRYAFMTAGWDLKAAGKLTLLAGQTDGLVNALHPESVAYTANPMFWQAGNYFRRSPQLRATWDLAFGDYGASLAVAALSSADANAPFDFGAGNRSGMPDFEARLGLSAKPMKDVNAAVGVSYHTNERTYDVLDPATNANAGTANVTASAWGVDLDVNVPYLGLRGEYFNGKGTDDMYNAFYAGVVDTNDFKLTTYTPPNVYKAAATSGFWAQAVLKPIPQAWLSVGYGQEKVAPSSLQALTAPTAVVATTARKENDALTVGLIGIASKGWRFGLEYSLITSKYNANADSTGVTPATKPTMKASQIALSTQLRF
jgi:hypothetical protein